MLHKLQEDHQPYGAGGNNRAQQNQPLGLRHTSGSRANRWKPQAHQKSRLLRSTADWISPSSTAQRMRWRSQSARKKSDRQCSFTGAGQHLWVPLVVRKASWLLGTILQKRLCVCVCCWNLCFLFYAIFLHTFQDFELAVLKPYFIKMFKVFSLKYPFFCVWGLGWTSKRLHQSFNFKSFWLVLTSKCWLGIGSQIASYQHKNDLKNAFRACIQAFESSS